MGPKSTEKVLLARTYAASASLARREAKRHGQRGRPRPSRPSPPRRNRRLCFRMTDPRLFSTGMRSLMPAPPFSWQTDDCALQSDAGRRLPRMSGGGPNINDGVTSPSGRVHPLGASSSIISLMASSLEAGRGAGSRCEDEAAEQAPARLTSPRRTVACAELEAWPP